jgi:5'-nucleotidase
LIIFYKKEGFMKILLTNDDGFRAKGFVALYEALREISDVTVVAPEQNNSGKSNSLTLSRPVYVHQSDKDFFYITGTPADCVHIALTGLLNFRPDLVISGMNNGANMGDDTIYSGTVGAAMEGYLFGVSSIAFSQTAKDWKNLDSAVKKAIEFIQDISNKTKSLPTPWLFNVNIPPLTYDELGPFVWCRLGRRHSAKQVIQQKSPNGEIMYWVGAAGDVADGGVGTDFHVTKHGNISVTPLQIDLTNYDMLNRSQLLADM